MKWSPATCSTPRPSGPPTSARSYTACFSCSVRPTPCSASSTSGPIFFTGNGRCAPADWWTQPATSAFISRRCVFFLWVGSEFAYRSILFNEKIVTSPWMPIIWPLKLAIPISTLLLLIQGVSELLKCSFRGQNGREPLRGTSRVRDLNRGGKLSMSPDMLGLVALAIAVHIHLRGVPDRLYPAFSRAGGRLYRHRPGGVQPDDTSSLRHHERAGAGGSSVLPVHGLHPGKLGPDGAAVQGLSADARPAQRLALHRRHGHGDHFRRGHGHRRLFGDPAGGHGRPDHAPEQI